MIQPMAKQLPIESKHVESFEVYAEDVFVIGRDTKDGPEHPCWRDDAKRDPSLMDTLLEEGQLQEALCRKAFVRGAKNELIDRVEIIFGVDRTISVREINKTRKPAERMKLRVRFVPKGTTDEEIVAMIEAENARRKKDASPIRKAESAKRMMRFKIDEATILRVQGLTHMDSVKRSLGLLELSPTLRKAVDAGVVPATTALGLKELPTDEQETKAAAWLAGTEEVPTAKAAVREVKEQKKAPEERSNKAEGEVGPPSDRLLGKLCRALKKIDDEKKPSPVSDHIADVIIALKTDEATRGSLPPDVQAILNWLRTGKGVKQIGGLTALIRLTEKPVKA